MALTGNRGEWSEIYAHFKLLADGILNDGDVSCHKTGNSLPIVKIVRKEKGAKQINYIVDKEEKVIRIDGENIQFQVLKEKFEEGARSLLLKIKKQKASDDKKKFSFPDIEEFMRSVRMLSLKASSKRKEDIKIVLHDIQTEVDRTMGFSIKSILGGHSTLLNSNKNGTNFRYSINGLITKDDVEYLNSLSETKQKRKEGKGFLSKWFLYFKEKNIEVKFDSIINETFKRNLAYIDSHFDIVLAKCLEKYYAHDVGNKVSDITKLVAEENPCNQEKSWYEYKMKQFLLTVALGMTPNKEWDCKYAANGGYIVVKENGEILCYHFYDRVQLENYLFYNTAFDTPSTSRHIMHRIYDNCYFNLNPQIRFIHKV